MTKEQRIHNRVLYLKAVRDGLPHSKADRIVAPLCQAHLIEVLERTRGHSAKTLRLTDLGRIWLKINDGMAYRSPKPRSFRGISLRHKESSRLIGAHLVKSHTDKDQNSLFVRFGEIMQRLEDLELRS